MNKNSDSEKFNPDDIHVSYSDELFDSLDPHERDVNFVKSLASLSIGSVEKSHPSRASTLSREIPRREALKNLKIKGSNCSNGSSVGNVSFDSTALENNPRDEETTEGLEDEDGETTHKEKKKLFSGSNGIRSFSVADALSTLRNSSFSSCRNYVRSNSERNEYEPNGDLKYKREKNNSQSSSLKLSPTDDQFSSVKSDTAKPSLPSRVNTVG